MAGDWRFPNPQGYKLASFKTYELADTWCKNLIQDALGGEDPGTDVLFGVQFQASPRRYGIGCREALFRRLQILAALDSRGVIRDDGTREGHSLFYQGQMGQTQEDLN